MGGADARVGCPLTSGVSIASPAPADAVADGVVVGVVLPQAAKTTARPPARIQSRRHASSWRQPTPPPNPSRWVDSLASCPVALIPNASTRLAATAIRNTLAGTGMAIETAERWCDAWEVEAEQRELPRDRDYWSVGADWIEFEHAAKRSP